MPAASSLAPHRDVSAACTLPRRRVLSTSSRMALRSTSDTSSGAAAIVERDMCQPHEGPAAEVGDQERDGPGAQRGGELPGDRLHRVHGHGYRCGRKRNALAHGVAGPSVSRHIDRDPVVIRPVTTLLGESRIETDTPEMRTDPQR